MTLATTDQVTAIVELAATYKLSDTERAKWWNKAGVSDWAEMDSATIEKCISYLDSNQNKKGV